MSAVVLEPVMNRPGKKRSPRITVPLPQDLYNRLLEYIESRNRADKSGALYTVSSVTRQALEELLDKQHPLS